MAGNWVALIRDSHQIFESLFTVTLKNLPRFVFVSTQQRVRIVPDDERLKDHVVYLGHRAQVQHINDSVLVDLSELLEGLYLFLNLLLE